MERAEFYARVGELLGTEHEGEAFRYSRRTRWNNREAGPGRYPGRGVVRYLGPRHIVLALREPSVYRVFQSEEAVIRFLVDLGQAVLNLDKLE